MPFETVDTTKTGVDRIITAVWGEAKAGKSTFALSFPGPLYLFNADYGYKEILRWAEGKELYVSDYALKEEFDADEYMPELLRFRQEWNEAVEQADARGGTVILDTASQFWQMIGPTMVAETAKRAARKSDKNMRTDYGPANLLMSTLLKRPHQAANGKVNAVYIQRAKEVYNEAGAATGKFQLHGFSETESIVQLVLNVFSKREVQLNKQGQPVLDPLNRPKMSSRVFGHIDRCRFGKEFESMTLENPTYDSLMGLLA